MSDHLSDELRAVFEHGYFPTPGDLHAKIHDRLRAPRDRPRRTRLRRSVRTFAVLLGTALIVSALIVAPRLATRFGAHGTAPHIPSSASTGPTQSPPQPNAGTYPRTFVGDQHPGLALYNSASGRLIRILKTGASGAEDQYPSVTGDGKTVYFVRCSCGDGNAPDGIWVVPTDGGAASVVVRDQGQEVDLDPTVSADGRVLAWLSTQRKVGLAIDVRDLTTGTQRAIPIAPNVEVDWLAWSPDDRHLLFTAETGPELELLDTATAASTSDGVDLQTSPCAELWPRFLPDGTFAALTCSQTGVGDVVAEFAPTTGRMLRVLQTDIPLPQLSPSVGYPLSPMSFSISPNGTSAIWTDLTRSANVWLWDGVRAVQLPASASELTW
jgi:hypothetical protein